MLRIEGRSAVMEKEIRLRKFLQTPVDSRCDLEKSPRKNINLSDNFHRNSFTSKRIRREWEDRMKRMSISRGMQYNEIHPHLMESAVSRPPVLIKSTSIEEVADGRARKMMGPIYIAHSIPQKRLVGSELRKSVFSRMNKLLC